jgi:hypothetical protein
MTGFQDQLWTGTSTYEPAKDGLLGLITWSNASQFSWELVTYAYAGRVLRPHVLESEAWRTLVASMKRSGAVGRTAYPIGVALRQVRDLPTQQLEFTFAESTYAEFLATMDLVNSRPDLAGQVGRVVAQSAEGFLTIAPPTLLTACVNVIGPANLLLVLRRSTEVRTFQNLWTVGINESMAYSDLPGHEENLFSLIQRALLEEVGLEPAEYCLPVLSWFGWSQPAGCFALVGTVRTTVPEVEILHRLTGCRSADEHDMADWLPLTQRTLVSIMDGSSCPDGSNAWAYHARLMASEAWRMREALDSLRG